MLMQSFIIPIIKVTDSCNFNCEFCYYSQKKLHSELMTLELCKKIIKETFEYNAKMGNKRMRIIFHGGEPLLQPITFYKELYNFENELKHNYQMDILHSIQTNGYNINNQWIELFQIMNMDVGISIDGPDFLNFHYNELGQKKCTDKVLENIQLLNQNNISYGIISVITNSHLNYAKEMYDFCIKNDIHNLSLNYCYNDDSDDSVDTKELVFFLKELFDLYFNGDYELNIREFNESIAKILGYCSDTCATCSRENCGQYMSFDSYGNIFFCDNAYDKNNAIGNLYNSSLYDIIDSSRYLTEIIKSRRNYEENCKNCSLSFVCGSGCYRYDNNLGVNYFCPTMKAINNYIINKINNND